MFSVRNVSIAMKGSFLNLLSSVLCLVSAAGSQPPNVIVFFIDDLGWKDLGCYGSTFHKTPNLDKLAAGGVRFTDSYSANPVCSPTRAAIMTGKAPQRIGITQWIHQPSELSLPENEITLAETFQAAGYTTGYIGKWHLGDKKGSEPSNHGFSWVRAVNKAGQPASYFYPYSRKNNRGTFWDVPDLQDGKKGAYLTDAITDEALKFIESNKNSSFFLFFSHYAVHTPIQAPGEIVGKYQAKQKKLYANSKATPISDRYNTVSRARQDHAAYAAMVEILDTNVGHVIKQLDQLGLTGNTIIVFTSDNGGHCHLKKRPGVTSNLPLRSGKGWTYEGGIRIPTIVSWPGTIKPSVSSIPTISMDLYPTLLDLTGQKLLPGQHLDGSSMKSALSGKPEQGITTRALYWTYPHNHGSGHKPSHAIRKDGWKLIRFEHGKPYELYNLTNDPGEKNDLAGKYSNKVKTLDQELTQWIKQTTP